ncbi:hypothetical protein EHI45_00995 [Rhizobium leguminosarum]|uniref:hypothetical protein n=1 Tax=Rhizobium leguminosarum TaxID=384 RepID=UPI000FEC8AF8|nr:hypothetical protein [Rhizobium leguminosarum]RWX19248.1 hypothetical protein EHI45_00995 [Rhizobium leguminosarum]
MDYYQMPLIPARVPGSPFARLDMNATIAIGETKYSLKHSDRTVLNLRDEDGGDFKITHQALLALIADHKASILRNRNTPEIKLLDLLYGDRGPEDYSKNDQLIAKFREQLFISYDKECLKNGHIPRSKDGTFAAWIKRNWGEIVFKNRRSDTGSFVPPPPSVSTFERRYTAWKKSNHNRLALFPRHFGPGKNKVSKWSAESVDFATVNAEAYLSPEKPRKTDVFLWYKSAIFEENQRLANAGEETLQPFGRTAFFNIIDTFPKFDVMCAREGEDYALKHFSPIARSFGAQMPGKEVELDCVKTDMLTLWSKGGQLASVPKKYRKMLKKIRIWFVVIVDRATRYVLAARAIVNPNGQAVLDAIRMMMTDKTLVSEVVGAKTPWAGHCVPDEVIFDNGSENTFEEVTQALQALGIAVTKPPAGAAADRPFIESLFHVIVPLFTSFFAGRTFASIDEKGDYDPAAHASLFVDEFVELFHLGICDIYHNRPHGSLGGRSPHNAWWEACEEYGVEPPPSNEVVLRAFGKPERITLDQYGVKRIGLSYRNPQLDQEYELRGRVAVDILVDSSRINDILVKGKRGWFLVENQNGLVTDMTEAEWQVARAEDLAANAAETEGGLGNMYSAVNRMRKSGQAAILRADLSPMRPSAEELAKRRRQLFSGYEPAPMSGASVPLISEVIIPIDELRDGSVSPVPRVVNVDAPPPAVRKVSKFNRKWEDE